MSHCTCILSLNESGWGVNGSAVGSCVTTRSRSSHNWERREMSMSIGVINYQHDHHYHHHHHYDYVFLIGDELGWFHSFRLNICIRKLRLAAPCIAHYHMHRYVSEWVGEWVREWGSVCVAESCSNVNSLRSGVIKLTRAEVVCTYIWHVLRPNHHEPAVSESRSYLDTYVLINHLPSFTHSYTADEDESGTRCYIM